MIMEHLVQDPPLSPTQKSSRMCSVAGDRTCVFLEVQTLEQTFETAVKTRVETPTFRRGVTGYESWL